MRECAKRNCKYEAPKGHRFCGMKLCGHVHDENCNHENKCVDCGSPDTGGSSRCDNCFDARGEEE